MPSHATLERDLEEPKGILVLWFGFLGSALAWKVQLVANYLLVPYACWHDLSILLHLTSSATVAVAAAAGWVAWAHWKAAGDETHTEAAGVRGRARWMGLSGAIFAAFFGLLILAQWIPNLLLSPCWE